jgi:antitoxin (DNA-binding transcriptional repressor) of toxin-antitoxin stability system
MQACLTDLIDRALRGERVVITRSGRPIAELRPIARHHRGKVSADDLDWLAKRRVGGKHPQEDAGALVSRIRDEDER